MRLSLMGVKAGAVHQSASQFFMSKKKVSRIDRRNR